MAKPTNSVKGFVRLTPSNGKEVLINLSNISTVRSTGEGSFVFLIRSPFNNGNGQDLTVIESYEEVTKRISEAS